MESEHHRSSDTSCAAPCIHFVYEKFKVLRVSTTGFPFIMSGSQHEVI